MPAGSAHSTFLEIYADFICPWSYIGLDRVARLARERDVELRWHPYLLRPDIPATGMPVSSSLPPDRLERAETAVREAVKAAGLPWNRPDRVPNTRHAHELGMLAETKGLSDPYYRAIFRAYFAEGQDIGDTQVLLDIGERLGMDRGEMQEAIRTGCYRAEIEMATDAAFAKGIRSVPNYVFASGKGFSGAQPYEIFLRFLDVANRRDLLQEVA